MRFILRKYVDAQNAAEALAMDVGTPVHDIYLKEGEEPKRNEAIRLIGFYLPAGSEKEIEERKKN